MWSNDDPELLDYADSGDNGAIQYPGEYIVDFFFSTF